nr:hypothetical protein [Tanacetum cinerariifolium]
MQTQTSNTLHNAIMEADGKDRPPMLAPGNYVQWRSRIKRYIDTKPNHELIHYCLKNPPYKFTWADKIVPVSEGSPETTTERYMETYKNVSQGIHDQLNADAEAVQIILTWIDNDIYFTIDACPNACEIWKSIKRLKHGESINVQDLETNLYWEFRKFTSRDGESLESYYSRFYKMMNELVRNQCDVTNHQMNVQFLLQLHPEWQRFVTLVKKSQELKTVLYHKLYDILKQHHNEVNELRAERIARTANPLALVAQQQPVYHPQNHPTHYTQNSSNGSQQAATRKRGKAIVNSPPPIYDQEPFVVAEDDEISKDKEIDKLMALISLSFKKIYKPTNNNLRTSSNTCRANQDNSPRINKGTRHVARECQKPKRVKDAVYHKEKMLLCMQEEAGIQLNAEQADWRDGTDDESEAQELEAHYIEHPEQSTSIHDTYPIEQDEHNMIIDSLDMSYDREQIDQDDDDDLANERDLLASLIKKLKCEIDDSKNSNKFLETSNKVLVDKLKGEIEDFKTQKKNLESSNNHFKEANNKLSETNALIYKDLKKFQAELDRRNDVKYASKMEIDSKEAQTKLYKTREDKELDKVISLENKVKILDNIVYKTDQSVQTMNMLNSKCKTSFANTEFLKKAQRANPRLYDIGCHNDNLALMLAPESDEVIRLEKESRSKLSKLIRPFDYEKLNNLYDLFVSQREKSSEQSLKAKTSNVNFVCATCGKYVLNDKHDMCVLKSLDGVNSRTKMPIAVPVSTREPKRIFNQSVAKPLRRTVASETANQTPIHTTRKIYERVRVIPTTSVSRPQLKSNPQGDKVMYNNRRGKKLEIEEHRRNVKLPKNKTSVTACNDSLNAKTLHVKSVFAMCDKRVLIDKHDICVLKSVDKPLKKTVTSESNNKPRNFTRKLYERVSKTCSWWYLKFTPSRYIWKPKSRKENVNSNVHMPLGKASRTANVMDTTTSRHSIVSNTPLSSNSFAAHKDCPIHRAITTKRVYYVEGLNHNLFSVGQFCDADLEVAFNLVQGAVTIKRVYYVEGLNHNLFSVGQFCDADLEVAFRKSTCYIRDLKGNDLLTSSRGTDLYSITLQDTTTPNQICLMAKATSSQAWLWHCRLSDLNFDTINLLLKNDIVIGLSKLKFVKDHLCSSYILGLIFLRSKDETPKVLIDFLRLVQRGLHAQSRAYRVFNKRTRVIVETIHVNFDELPHMASDHVSSDPVSQCPNTALEHDILSPGELKFFLGIQIHQSPRGIFINQAKYAQEILIKHGMTTCDSVGTLMATKHLDADLSGTPVDQTKYRSMIGTLMYLIASRPDIVHATCYYARYQAKPIEKHLCDSDHAGCLDSRKSTSGGIQFLGGDKLVRWSSKKQDCTLISSAEAEYVYLSACCTQVLWMRTQLTDYGFHFDKIPMYCDSKAAIAILCNPVQHFRTKHIDVRYHFIKEKVENGIVELFFVGTEYPLADLFTKALPEERFMYLFRRLGVRCLTQEELEVLANESA